MRWHSPTAEPPPRAWPERLLAGALDWLLPGPCAACGGNVDDLRPRLALCQSCRRAWPQRHLDRCTLCGRPLGSKAPVGYRCGGCRRRRVPHADLTVGWDYAGPVAASLRALKFHRLNRVGGDLVDLLIDNLAAAELTRLSNVSRVTAVPLWRWRRLARGYNQAEILARHIARRLGLPYTSMLTRVSASRPQSQLSRGARRANVRSSMRLHCSPRPCESILLVDDVTTTGATLEEAARTLRRAGADEVVLLALARTPEP